jgi:hypothetical protein
MAPLTGDGLLLTDQAGKTKVRVAIPPVGQIQAPSGPDETILVNGATSSITIKSAGRPMITLTAEAGTGEFPFPQPNLTIRDIKGNKTIELDGNEASLTLRAAYNGKNTFFADGNKADLFVGGGGQHGNLTVRDGADADIIVLRAGTGEMAIGGGGIAGKVRVQNGTGLDTVVLDGEGGISATGSISTNGDLSAAGNLSHQTITERSRKIGVNQVHELFSADQDGAFIVELAAALTDPNSTLNNKPLARGSYSRWVALVYANTGGTLTIASHEQTAGEFWKDFQGPELSVASGNVKLSIGALASTGSLKQVFRDGTLSVRALYGSLLNF